MKKISALLCVLFLATANLLAAESYSNIPNLSAYKTGFNISAMDTDSDVPVITLTDAQYNGVDPINLPLDEKLSIEVPISNLNNLNANEINISEDNSLIYIESKNYASGTFTPNGFSGTLTIDMTCTPLEEGTTTITVTYAGAVIKKFTINVTDPVGLE